MFNNCTFYTLYIASTQTPSPLLVRTSSLVGHKSTVSLKDELESSDSEPYCSPTVEARRDIDEKAFLKNAIESAMDYLKRSLAIMIKSIMSRLYGTKEVLTKLHQINSELQHLEQGAVTKQQKSTLSGKKAIFDSLVNSRCKFWNQDCSNAQDWVYHSRQKLPRKKDPQEEWKELTEDLKTWKLDICLKLINRATHDKVPLFASQHVCFKTDNNVEYNFKTMADKATVVRNFYAHPATYKDVIERYAQDFRIVEEFAIKVLLWVEQEDGDTQLKTLCQENLRCIQQKQNAYRFKHTAKWDKVLDGLKNLNFNDFEYILVSTPCTGSAGVTICASELAQLSNIPWAAVVDYDISSRKQNGLLHSLCETEGGQYKLKVSCQSPYKRTVIPFSYVDISGAERGELCRDGRIPWIFPHGESQNKSNEACPFSNHQQYRLIVRKPLVASMRKITSTITQNKTQGAVSVVLCYGDYGYKSERLPHENFLDDLRHLCNNLADDGGYVVVLSDSVFLAEYLKPLPVFIFPLKVFCKTIQEKLTFGQGELSPLNMPSLAGLRRISFDAEDFDLIHECVAEHELYQYRVQKLIELQQQNEIVSDTVVRSGIQYELRENFYKGQTVTWISLDADHAITRREESEITNSIRELLKDRVYEKTEPTKYVIYHTGGAGATTLARKIIYTLRKEFPCVILKSSYKHSDGKIKGTSQALKSLYEDRQYPILMLIDEEPSFKTIPNLTKCVQANGTPVVFLQVQRFDPSKSEPAEQEVKGSKNGYILPSALHKDDAIKLKHKLYVAFGHDKISAGDRNVAEMESAVVVPSEGDKVTDLVQNGTIFEQEHKKSGLGAYYLVKVRWDNQKEEMCIIGSFAGKANASKYRSVYLNAEISRVYETFHFYGIMYLDEEFREPMRKHIKNCLSRMLPQGRKPDDMFHKQLLVLAYLSILFAFKVCESIHIKSFEYLCYMVTKSGRTEKFNLEPFIPNAALQFMIITREGQFRIIHPIVAYEIIKFYSSMSSSSFPFPPEFVCDFLKYMLPEIEYPNKEATLAINRLLRYREYVDDGTGHLTRKPFSELILTLHKQNPQHAIQVLDYSADLINDCHSYAHYARYMSKKIQEHDRALEILGHAEKLAYQFFEEGLVLNIKGDIYRERLEMYVKNNDSLDWDDVNNNKAFEFHFRACQAYQESFKKHHDDFPLFNELNVRLNLLEAIKRKCKLNEKKFVKFIHCIQDEEVAKSTDTCFHLVKELKDYICVEDGQRDLDGCADEAHLKSLESRLLNIIGSSKEKRKEILYELMTKFAAYVKVPNVRRSYIHLCQLDSGASVKDMDTCLQILESNFTSVGHADRDMLNWLLIVRNLPNIGGNVKKVEEKLLSWKQQGPCMTAGKHHIQAQNNPIFVNFYLTVCYFIQMVEAEAEEIPQIVKKFNIVHQEMKQQSKNNKLRFRIKEWLHKDGVGFGRLKSGRFIQNDMMQLPGLMGIPSWPEALQSRGEKGFPYITWMGLQIPFDAKRYSNCHYKQGDRVSFGVGFTLRGPQAIVFTSDSPASAQNSPCKRNSQQGSQAVGNSSQTFSYSQAAKTTKTDRRSQKKLK